MGNQVPPKALVSSPTLTVILSVLAMMTVLSAPIPALSVESTAGRCLYIGSIVVVAGLLIWTNRREQRRQQWEQEQRDSKFAQGHQEIVGKLMAIFAKQQELLEQRQELIGRIPPTDPRVQAVEQAIAGTRVDLDKAAKVDLPRYIGYAPRVTVTAPDGTVVHDSGAAT